MKKNTEIWILLIFISFGQSFAFSPNSEHYDFGFEVMMDRGSSSDIVQEVRRSARENLFCDEFENCERIFPLPYSEARRAVYLKVDTQKDDFGHYIKDVYCHEHVDLGKDGKEMPNHNDYNIEHTWPQSRFKHVLKGKMIQTAKADMHHLYPTQNLANNIRSSFEFGNVKKNSHNKLCEGSKLGVSSDGRFETFNPPADHIGNVARALFYFSIKYDLRINSSEEKVLRFWHILDPVDKLEKRRNNIIHELQGNRNPFIDFPEAVDKINNF